MSVVVFVGPTLSVEEARREIDAICLPPAAQGDLYRAVAADPQVTDPQAADPHATGPQSTVPQAIGLIDGYFQSVPAVWHKEILWALSHGVHVFGSASMGALRAAELADFGMVGVGEIYRQFADGRLQDDDEVAVIHAPAEFGYRRLSEALVDIRSTLSAAAAARVIAPDLHENLLRIAKGLHYPLRSYDRLLELARHQGLDETPLSDLEGWLPEGRVDQKRADALAMLRAMRAHLAGDSGPHRPSFTFEPNLMWSRMVEESDRDEAVTTEIAPDSPAESPVRDFLRRVLD